MAKKKKAKKTSHKPDYPKNRHKSCLCKVSVECEWFWDAELKHWVCIGCSVVQ